MAKRKDEYDENGLPVSLPQGIRGMTSTLTGSQQTPGQIGTALGQVMGELLAGLPENTPLAKSAAATFGSKVDGLGHIVAAAANPNQDLMNEYNKTASLSADAALAALQKQADAGTGPYASQGLANATLTPAAGNSPFAQWQQQNVHEATAAATKAKTAETQLQAFTGSVTRQPDTSYVSVKQANARTKLKSLLSSGRPMGVQEIADLIKEGGGPGAANAYETALKLNTLQKEHIKTMNPADFQNYGDAFQHAQLNGMNMSEALKFASDWSKIAPQGQQSSSQASPRESGLYEAPSGKAPAAVAERWAAEAAAHKTARDVAQRIREGIKPQPAPAPTPTTPPAATAPAKRTIREIDREQRELAVAAAKRQAQASKLNTIMTENKIKDDAMLEVLGEAFADDADGKLFEAFQALKPMQKQAQLTRWKTIWLARRKKEQTDGQ